MKKNYLLLFATIICFITSSAYAGENREPVVFSYEGNNYQIINGTATLTTQANTEEYELIAVKRHKIIIKSKKDFYLMHIPVKNFPAQ